MGIVSLSDFTYSGSSVESLSEGFVGVSKGRQLSGEFGILSSDDTDVVVQGGDLSLEVGVDINRVSIGVLAAVKLFP